MKILAIGKDAMQAGVARISISTLIRPKFEAGRLAVEKVNSFLRELCRREGFNIIDQSNIWSVDMGDAIHVNWDEGTNKLRNNIYSGLYTFKPTEHMRRDRG